MPRITPLDPPYPEPLQDLFDLAMPEGMDPLVLFRVLAKNERLLPRFMRGGILDKGPIPIRDREILVHRTTALCGADYEWGVPVNAFGRPLELGEELILATVEGDESDPAFDDRQSVLIALCDSLHQTSTIGDPLWERLTNYYDELQIQELIYTVGFYHMVSFLCNGMGLENEPFGATFAEIRTSARARA